MGILMITNRGFHGDWPFGNLQNFSPTVFGHFHALAQLFWGRLTAHFLKHLTRNTIELVDGLNHVHRNTNGACLVSNGASDRLANPPSSVSRELIATTVFELIARFP